ncbi:MAG: hypothetical protein ACI97A_002948 [Planctomycetota bacterium]|jgi:hypothetical protein
MVKRQMHLSSRVSDHQNKTNCSSIGERSQFKGWNVLLLFAHQLDSEFDSLPGRDVDRLLRDFQIPF